MATNLCSRKRAKYIKVKDFAAIFDISDKTVYQMIKNPVFKETVKKVGNRGIRLDENKMIEVMKQQF